MNKVDTSVSHSLLCLEVGSISAGYVALNAATAEKKSTSFRVLEASPIGSQFLILVLGEDKELRAALQSVRDHFEALEPSLVTDAEIITGVQQSLLDSLYALSQSTLEESLLVVETKTVSACLQAAQILTVGHGLSSIEVRIQRTSTGGAYGFFTGPAEKCLLAMSDARAQLKAEAREGRIDVVERPTPTLRTYLEIAGD